MDEITHAYIKVRGECPSGGYNEAKTRYILDRGVFRSGWKEALAWAEHQELLEIEKDVLRQQEELR